MFGLSSNQIYSFFFFALAALYVVGGLNIEEGFYSDPVGSNFWVVGIGCVIMVLSILLFFSRRDFVGNFPPAKEWLAKIPFILAIFLYSYLLPVFGYAIATPLLMLFVGLDFKAGWKGAVVSALSMSLGCYLVFDFLLDISLPAGSLWR